MTKRTLLKKKPKALFFANVIISSAIIILSLFIIYILYKSILLQDPVNIRLFAVIIIGLLLSFSILLVPVNWKINTVVLISSTIISLYILEISLFFYESYKSSKSKIDIRNKLEVIEDLRAEGFDAWPQVLSWLFTESNGLLSGHNRLFPLGGISNKTIVYCNESGQYKIFESDEHGFNNPKGLYKKGIIKTALIGDSFTIGSCVKDGEDIASHLRNIGINTLNLGNGGNGPLIELAILKEYASPFQPEIVLWIYYEGNDLLDLERERRASILMHYLKDDNYTQNLLQKQEEIDAALIKYVNAEWAKRRNLHNTIIQESQKKENSSIQKIVKLRRVRKRLGLLLNTHKAKRQVSYKSQLPLFSEILATAKRWVSNWGGKLYFVYLPTMERYTNDYGGNFYDRDDVLSIVHKLGIPLIDFHKVLSEHPDPLSLTPFLGAHYNAQGYKLLSGFIVMHLKKDGAI